MLMLYTAKLQFYKLNVSYIYLAIHYAPFLLYIGGK